MCSERYRISIMLHSYHIVKGLVTFTNFECGASYSVNIRKGLSSWLSYGVNFTVRSLGVDHFKK